MFESVLTKTTAPGIVTAAACATEPGAATIANSAAPPRAAKVVRSLLVRVTIRNGRIMIRIARGPWQRKYALERTQPLEPIAVGAASGAVDRAPTRGTNLSACGEPQSRYAQFCCLLRPRWRARRTTNIRPT